MEEGVEFNSTPFVFFTDTFTGEFLCGGDVILKIIREII